MLQGTIFQITKSETNSTVIPVFEYICHYGPVILLLCMTTSETGQFFGTPCRLLRSASIREFFRQRLHGTGSDWNRYEIGARPGRSGTDRICYLIPNVSTYEDDPIWNRTLPVSNLSRVNRVDPYHNGSDPTRI